MLVPPVARQTDQVLRQPAEVEIDQNGHMVLPMSVMAESGLDPGTTVVAYSGGDGRIVLRRSSDAAAELLTQGTLS